MSKLADKNMSGYKPPFNITNEILTYVSSISEKIGKISATSNLETKPHLRRNNRIKSIHSSLKIEANSLSLDQVRDVINGKLVLGEQKEIYVSSSKICSGADGRTFCMDEKGEK